MDTRTTSVRDQASKQMAEAGPCPRGSGLVAKIRYTNLKSQCWYSNIKDKEESSSGGGGGGKNGEVSFVG